ncbi:hypothetical protein HPB50_013755 [Hyalomma asiaticum]|uniref:Uncharacterized protein n=1 Tax=Hyalomma asiaticum TaxID=266040 RepID=A0ACB7TK29_HYAAI|nr:hypothetical protein HPB50_013755 [Hyalomma asiaticum]
MSASPYKKNGWMTLDKLQDRLSRVWGPNSDDVQRLPVLDHAPIHKMQATKDALEQFTAVQQRRRVHACRLHKQLTCSGIGHLRPTFAMPGNGSQKNEDGTTKGNLRKPSQQDALDLVSEAWAAVTEETVAHSFKGCGLASMLDGSEDGQVHDCLCDISAVVPEHRKGFQTECLDLVV